MQILILISNFNNNPCLFLNYRFMINDTWVRKIPGEGNGNPLHYYCLENPMDREAW